jgi:hypothetical protein
MFVKSTPDKLAGRVRAVGPHLIAAADVIKLFTFVIYECGQIS